ncbi:hypothetical protein SteCoe_32722 [Stentor coeruleus]|uniref:Uncharacterized protein n=1 Tax=Stentor coeruleus TaxID=5963 RepID=A0A1R2AYC6_9CILI|nr:hypothetical protein SteCoe_32722 [Stentor coeruleus]
MSFKKPHSMTPDCKKVPSLPYKSITLSPFSLLRKKLLRHYIPNKNSIIASIPTSPRMLSNTKQKICINSILEITQRTKVFKKSLQNSPYKISSKLNISKENYNISLASSVDIKSNHETYYKPNHKLNPLTSDFSKKIREKYPLLIKGSQIITNNFDI